MCELYVCLNVCECVCMRVYLCRSEYVRGCWSVCECVCVSMCKCVCL